MRALAIDNDGENSNCKRHHFPLDAIQKNATDQKPLDSIAIMHIYIYIHIHKQTQQGIITLSCLA